MICLLSLELRGDVSTGEYRDLGIIDREKEMKAMGLDESPPKRVNVFKEQKRFRQI